MSRDVARLGRNFALSLGGEAVQSGFHFLLNLGLIRLLSAYDFGIFAIAFVIGGIAIAYGNALVSVPAAVHLPRLKSSGAVNYQDVMFGSIALLFALAVAVAVTGGLLLTIRDVEESLAAGAMVGLWTLRNHIRTVMFARGMTPAATISDISYVASGVVLTTLLIVLHPEGGQATSALWGLALANLLATTVALGALRLRLRVSFRHSVRRRYRMIWSDIAWSVFGTTTWNIQSQALTFLVAAIAGPAAYAPVAAGMLLFTPLRPAVNAFVNVFRTDFVIALKEEQYHRLNRMLHAVCGVIILACAAVGVVIWMIWPLLDTYIFAGKFAEASLPLIVALSGLSAVAYLTYNVPLALIQAAGHFKPVALATTFGGLTGLCATAFLLGVTTVAWSLAGVVAGEAVCGIYLWVAGQRILGQRTAPAWAVGRVAEARP